MTLNEESKKKILEILFESMARRRELEDDFIENLHSEHYHSKFDRPRSTMSNFPKLEEKLSPIADHKLTDLKRLLDRIYNGDLKPLHDQGMFLGPKGCLATLHCKEQGIDINKKVWSQIKTSFRKYYTLTEAETKLFVHGSANKDLHCLTLHALMEKRRLNINLHSFDLSYSAPISTILINFNYSYIKQSLITFFGEAGASVLTFQNMYGVEPYEVGDLQPLQPMQMWMPETLSPELIATYRKIYEEFSNQYSRTAPADFI